jgi:hypothetical protein
MFKKIVLASMLSAALAGAAAPAISAIIVQVAPPAMRDEIVPAPRSGYLWSPGYWDWRNNRHVWAKGSWQRERHGYHYAQPAWEQRDGSWQMNRGAWVRGDRDH